MRRRFFVDHIHSGKAEISGDDAKHLTRVLRVETGQRYEISDNHNVYLAEVESARKEHVLFRTVEKLEPPAPSVHVTLCAALVKFDAFEWMIEKATELGVSEIIPVETIRSERGLEKAAWKRIERWRKIALEASQQSRRAHLPTITEPVEFEEVLKRPAAFQLVLDEAGGVPLLNALPATRSVWDQVNILIGPEGGWADVEREAFEQAGWTKVSLGPLILRAETAALAALAVVRAHWLVH
jgi:16S rRNA (uracil1498-N3)-methyltransferase